MHQDNLVITILLVLLLIVMCIYTYTTGRFMLEFNRLQMVPHKVLVEKKHDCLR